MDPTKGPRELQRKVMFDIRFYFARRGAENIKQMKVDTFKVVFDKQLDLVYVKKDKDEMTKNHKEVNSEIITGYMPEMRGSKYCPVDSFHEYISHLNPNNENLWQSPISKPKTSVWYADCPVGDHTLSEFMKNVSKKAKLSQIYTNHDIRVTGLSVLGRVNFTDKQIMSVSGHKSTDSLKIYQKVSGNEEFMMGYTLGYALKSPQDIPIGPVQRNFLETPPQTKRAILPKPCDHDLIPKRQKLEPIPQVCAPVTPLQNEANITENAVAIPEEYDFDLLQLISETDMDEEDFASNALVPVTTTSTANALVPVTTTSTDSTSTEVTQTRNSMMSTSTNNTQINIGNPQRRLPGFYNCSIGTINFNVYQK